MVGRLSRAALKLYTKANADALAVLTPMPRQLGAFGLLRGMAAVAEALVKVDAAANKV